MDGIITGIAVGVVVGFIATVIGAIGGYYLYRNAFIAGAKILDNIHRNQVPFDEELNTEPLDTHTDGVNITDEEEA